MIEINLLPQEQKKKKIGLPKIPIIPIAVFLIAGLAVIQILLTAFIFANKAELARLEKKWRDLKPIKTKIDELKKNVSMAGKKAEAIEELVAERFSWARLLNELSNSLTPNVWLTELRYDEKAEVGSTPEQAPKPQGNLKDSVTRSSPERHTARALTISGSAAGKGEEGTTYVARFIQALKDNRIFFRNFDDIELVSIKTGSVAGSDVMNFILICRFKPEQAR